MTMVPARDAQSPLVLALDLGSSSLRAIVYDRSGHEVEGTEGRTPTRWALSSGGGVEADPDAILDGTSRAIDQALAGAGKRAADIRAVGISTFWHNIMGIGGDGGPTTPLYSWADERSAGAARTLRRLLDEEVVRRRTGCVFHPSYPAARLFWLREAAPEVYRKTRLWLSIGEYLALRWSGRAVCSVSMASGSGLLDQRRFEWDGELLDVLGLAPGRLAPLVDLTVPLDGLVSPWAERWPVLARIPWLPAAGDGALGNIGAGCMTPARAALSMGTTGAMRVMHAGPMAGVPRALWNYRADKTRALVGGAVSNGGNVFQWVRELVALGPPEEVEQALRSRAPDVHGLVVLPFLAGERSPDWPLGIRGAVFGITLATGPLDLLQASLEAVAYRVALVWDALRGAVPGVREIVAGGGALLRSPAWMQIVADALGHELITSGVEEGSSRGAALVALEALGAVHADALPADLGAVVCPDPERHARYREARDRQRRVEAALAPLQDAFGT